METKFFIPKDMTPAKLRSIAEWMDIADTALERLGEFYEKSGRPELKDRLEKARGLAPRTEVQDDLRRWASEIEGDE